MMSPMIYGGLATIGLLAATGAVFYILLRISRNAMEWWKEKKERSRVQDADTTASTTTTMLSRVWSMWLISLVGWVAIYAIQRLPGLEADSYLVTVAFVMAHALMAGATIVLAWAGLDRVLMPWFVLREKHEQWEDNPSVMCAFVIGYFVLGASFLISMSLLIGGVE